MMKRHTLRYFAWIKTIEHNVVKVGWHYFVLIPCGVNLRKIREHIKLIFDQEMYTFLATPGIEVTNLFAGNEVVWISWRHAQEAHVPNLRHTNEVIGSYVTAGE
jgi:hypothetical protein